jgi:hypothetical protein
MPTFIDESGDTGPHESGGTRLFLLAAVWVSTLDDADLFRQGVRRLRALKGLRGNYEFKFSKTQGIRDTRAEFYGVALAQDFRFAVSVIDKTESHWASSDRHELHWATTTELAALMRPTYEEAEKAGPKGFRELVVVDDNRNADYLAVLKRQFHGLRSARTGAPFVGKVSFRNSAPDEMLQLVDMVCGAASAYFDNSDRVWYELIAERNVES